MSYTTERLILPVKGDVEDWKEAVKFMLTALKRQPGYTRTRWGPLCEDQQKLELLIGWENIGACETWNASTAFQEMMSHLKPVLTGAPTVYFVTFHPSAPKELIDSKVVEAITFEGAGSEEELRAQVSKAQDIAGCNGCSAGMAYGPGAPANTLVALVGWADLETSQAADKSYAAGATDCHHVNFNFPVKGFGTLGL